MLELDIPSFRKALRARVDTLECQAGCIADPLLRQQDHFFRTGQWLGMARAFQSFTKG